MREDLCSIPINDIFKEYHDCPFCFMRDMLEEHLTTYITGAAMMQPDVRVETNASGFCKAHFDMMLKKGNRLSVALILQTLLAQVDKEQLSDELSLKRQLASVIARGESCFICENLDKHMLHLFSCLISLYEKDDDFKRLYKEQKGICTHHFGYLLSHVSKKNKEFLSVSRTLAKKHMASIRQDIDEFCNLFDYRNKTKPTADLKLAIEHAVENLSGRKPDIHIKAEDKNR